MPNEPNPFADRIHIEQLEIFARVGVPEKERSTPQQQTVSITNRYFQKPVRGQEQCRRRA
jgi:dihydroneopterin aldolase